MTTAASDSLKRTIRVALPFGIAGAIASVAGLFMDRASFFHAYLFAWFFWLGFPLGCIGILLIHHLLGGAWGVVTRRFFEAGAATILFVAILSLPLLLGLPINYLWAQPGVAQADPQIAHKLPYLNAPFFIARTTFYFAVWIALAWMLNRESQRQDSTSDPEPTKRLETISAPGLIAFFLTTTFASMDWLMSLEPHWYSTIYGLIVVAGQGVGALALTIVIAAELSPNDPALERAFTPQRFHDLGTLLFTFVFFWAYLAYSQLVIIWSGNLTHEIPWFLHRIGPGWTLVTAALFVLQFVLPFTLLLFRVFKRNKRSLYRIAWLVLIAHAIDTYWLIEPEFSSNGFSPHWLTFATFVGVGGIWISVYAWRLSRYELLPRYAPGLEEALNGTATAPPVLRTGGVP